MSSEGARPPVRLGSVGAAPAGRGLVARLRALFAPRVPEPRWAELAAQIVSLSPTAVAVLDGPEHRYAIVNDAYRAIARGKGDVVGRTLVEVWPEAGPEIVKVLDRVFETGEPFRAAEASFPVERDRGPETIWLTFSFLPIRAPAGPVERILVLANEVTEHVRSTQSARARAAELEAVLEAAPIPIFITRDADARRIEANPAAQELVGVGPRANASLSAPAGERARFVPMRDGVPIPLDEMPMQAAARFGRETRDLEYDIVRADGQVRRVVANARPIVDSEGVRRGAVGAFIDVTHRKAAEDRVRQADARKSEFLAVLSHELRNPLAPIRSSLHLLDRAPPGSSAALRAREVLHRQTEHLTRLVDDLLDLTRVTHGKFELQPTRLDAGELVRRACSDVRALFDERKIELRWTAGREPAWVDADAARLAQAVGNLLQNALKFTAPGGHVAVEVAARERACDVSVRDDGIGIDPADLERIFEPFVQGGRASHGAHGGGLGIGLALVRELAVRHRGSVRASSAGPGRGATFVLSLPLASGPPEVAAVAAPEPAASSLSILVVEDNVDAGATLADVLALGGHAVRVVTTGRAGLDAAREAPPDVLVCDVGLPDMTGHDVIRALRAAASGPLPFAIALTGYAQPEDRDAALEAGFDAHLAKPPPLQELNALLAGAARRRA